VVALVERDDRRPEGGERPAVGVPLLRRELERRRERAAGVLRAPQEPQDVGEARHADGLGVLPVAQEVGGPVLGAVPGHGGLEVGPRRLEAPGPVGRDPEDVGPLDPEDVVALALAAVAQPVAARVRGAEVAAGEARERQRAHEGRGGLGAQRAREREGLLVHRLDPG
jgi:hypothetical protein